MPRLHPIFPHVQEGDEEFPRDANGTLLYSDVPFTETWKAMEKMVEKGFVKSIGLANFNSEQINEILSIAKIRPVVNQVENAASSEWTRE